MWKRYFNFIKLRPGRVVTQQFGELDFSSDKIPVETVKALYENDFPYLEITPEGKELFYGIAPEILAEEAIVEEADPPEVIPETETVELLAEESEKTIRRKKK